MKKLALALVCLVSVAFFASCTPDITNPEPSIQVLQGEGYIQDNDVVDIDVPYTFGFVVASNPQTNKDLSKLVVKVGDIEWANVDLTGMKEYTHIDTVEWGFEKDIVYTDIITAVVTDVDGKTATATINVSVNQPAQPLVARTFTWNRHGGNDGTGLAEFGLKWEKNLAKAIYAIIEPVDGATLYKFDPSVWDATTTDVEKAALFSEATPANPQQWKEFNVAGAMTQEFDVVLGTAYNGEYHLMHITKGTYYTFKGTDATIEGEAK